MFLLQLQLGDIIKKNNYLIENKKPTISISDEKILQHFDSIIPYNFK